MKVNFKGLVKALPGIGLYCVIQFWLDIKGRFSRKRRAIELDEYERSLS